MRNNGIRWLRALLCSCLLLGLLSGCWSSIELNDNAFARVLMLDKAPEGIEMTIEFPLPNRMVPSEAGGGEKGDPFTFVTKRDSTMGRAYRDIQSDLSRRISFGQLRIVVVSRALAEEGLQEVMDFLAREPKIHINSNIFITEGKTAEIASIPVEFERFPSDILSNYAESRVTLDVMIADLLKANYSGGDFVVPLLVFGREGTAKGKAGQQWMGTDGAAVFRNGKMVGRIDTNEMRGALWIMDQIKNSEVNVASPTDGKSVSFIVSNARTRIRPVIGKPMSIHIDCRADAEVLSSQSNINLEDPDKVLLLERQLNAKLEERIDSAIAKTKALQSDAFRLGDHVRWRYYRLWQKIKNDWRTLYADQVTVRAHADVSLKRIGGIRKAVGINVQSREGESE